jgi:F0F1-type ATP synthase membrane subunit b/b'
MPANTKSTSTTTTTTKPKTTDAKPRTRPVDYVRQSAERVVDLPVGAALTAHDRVNEVVEPWTKSETRERELKSLRTQVTRELNRFERRGGQARRKATRNARTTRNRVERELKARRREITRTVKDNRVRAEEQLKKAQTAVQERVPALS